MDSHSWDAFFSSLRVEGRITYPAYAERELARSEGELGIRLPESYREFCRTFGPGQIGHPFTCNIAAPGPTGWESCFELSYLGTTLGAAYAEDIAGQGISRPLMFASDVSSFGYFWNTHEVTGAEGTEYAIYVVYRLGEIDRLADTFFDFVSRTLLVDGIPNDDTTVQRKLMFEPVSGPFPSVHLPTEWRTSTAVAIARHMDETRDFSAMPILADALQDAGCADEDILSHCRGPGPHVRGCWVVDLVLGKE